MCYGHVAQSGVPSFPPVSHPMLGIKLINVSNPGAIPGVMDIPDIPGLFLIFPVSDSYSRFRTVAHSCVPTNGLLVGF